MTEAYRGQSNLLIETLRIADNTNVPKQGKM